MIGSPEKSTPDSKKGQGECATTIETDDDTIPRGHNMVLTTFWTEHRHALNYM